jgi:ABC-2 type transport system permease protein
LHWQDRQSRCWSPGLAAGLTYGVAAGDVGGSLAAVVGNAAVQLPAAWLLAAVTLALLAIAPRFMPVAWACWSDLLRCTRWVRCTGLPQWLPDLEPLRTSFRVGGGSFGPVPLLWLPAIDAALVAVGVAAFRRRDVRC